MKYVHVLAAALLATTVAGGAYAAEQAAKPETPALATAETAADRDVGKLSKDGASAFQDLHAARLAIFNAEPKEAKTLIDKAAASIDKARQDDAVYRKAEADFDAKLNKAEGRKTVTEDPSKDVAWLPIDGQLTLGADYVASPEKTAALKTANEHVQKGDRKGAIDALKLADVDVDFTMAVLPLDPTVTDIDHAAKLIDEGKYYEANALLKGTEERMRFDAVDVTGVPKADHTATGSVKADAAPAPAPAAATQALPAK